MLVIVCDTHNFPGARLENVLSEQWVNTWRRRTKPNHNIWDAFIFKIVTYNQLLKWCGSLFVSQRGRVSQIMAKVWTLTLFLVSSFEFTATLLPGEAAVQKIPQSPVQENAGWTRSVKTGRLGGCIRGWRLCDWCGRLGRRPHRVCRRRPPGSDGPRSGCEPRHVHVYGCEARHRGHEVRSASGGQGVPPVIALSKHGDQPLHFHSEQVRIRPGPLGCSLCLHQQEGPPGKPQRCWIKVGKWDGRFTLFVVVCLWLAQSWILKGK